VRLVDTDAAVLGTVSGPSFPEYPRSPSSKFASKALSRCFISASVVAAGEGTVIRGCPSRAPSGLKTAPTVLVIDFACVFPLPDTLRAYVIAPSKRERTLGLPTRSQRHFRDPSTKAGKPDPLLPVQRTEEPQQGGPDGNGRLPHGGKTLAQKF
jgi:hypothetical protein